MLSDGFNRHSYKSKTIQIKHEISQSPSKIFSDEVFREGYKEGPGELSHTKYGHKNGKLLDMHDWNLSYSNPISKKDINIPRYLYRNPKLLHLLRKSSTSIFQDKGYLTKMYNLEINHPQDFYSSSFKKSRSTLKMSLNTNNNSITYSNGPNNDLHIENQNIKEYTHESNMHIHHNNDTKNDNINDNDINGLINNDNDNTNNNKRKNIDIDKYVYNNDERLLMSTIKKNKHHNKHIKSYDGGRLVIKGLIPQMSMPIIDVNLPNNGNNTNHNNQYITENNDNNEKNLKKETLINKGFTKSKTNLLNNQDPKKILNMSKDNQQNDDQTNHNHQDLNINIHINPIMNFIKNRQQLFKNLNYKCNTSQQNSFSLINLKDNNCELNTKLQSDSKFNSKKSPRNTSPSRISSVAQVIHRIQKKEKDSKIDINSLVKRANEIVDEFSRVKTRFHPLALLEEAELIPQDQKSRSNKPKKIKTPKNFSRHQFIWLRLSYLNLSPAHGTSLILLFYIFGVCCKSY